MVSAVVIIVVAAAVLYAVKKHLTLSLVKAELKTIEAEAATKEASVKNEVLVAVDRIKSIL